MSTKYDCKYCRGNHHESKCSIMLKAELLKKGINVFDNVIFADDLEEAADLVADLIEDVTREAKS